MADLTITPADVVIANVNQELSQTKLIAGEAIDAGEVFYINSADGKAYLAESGDTEAKAQIAGMAAVSAAASQPLQWVTRSGLAVTITSGATVGQCYVVSNTAGKIAPLSDLLSTDWVTQVGFGTVATELTLFFAITGVQKP